MIIVTLNEANTYFSTRLHSEAWTAATVPNREKSLVQAGTIIYSSFRWSDEASRLDTNENRIWNDVIRYAVCEQALWLLTGDSTTYPENLCQGISKAAANGNNVQFDKEFIRPYLCPVALRLVGNLGSYIDPVAEGQGFITSTLLDR